jgi:hypothetical protein
MRKKRKRAAATPSRRRRRPAVTPEQAAWNELRSSKGMITKLANGLGISKQAVSQWRVVPFEHAEKVERITSVSIDSRCPVCGQARHQCHKL